MTTLSTPELILEQIAQIRRMERGKLCQMRPGPNGPYYSHQTWEKGRNVVRYVPRGRAPALQTAIAGYQDYLKLTQAYADLIIARTRQEQPNSRPQSPGQRKTRQEPTGRPTRKDAHTKKS
jgi:hypothetical protein